MKKKFFVMLVMMLMIITAFHTTTGSKISTQEKILDIKIEINQPKQELNSLNDPIEVYEGQHLQVTITGYWEPPNPTKTICLWADDTTMPSGATLDPPCHCAPGQVSSILEWTPAVGQAGIYVITFYLGEYCEVPLKSFTITIIVHPAQNNPPVVTITSPADGSVVTEQHVTLHGLVTDDNGIISIGSHHEWTDGETITSGTIDPAQTYYPFDWAFDLYEGWNRITIFVTDGTNPAEDSIDLTYNPSAGIIPGITFNQVEYRFEDGNKILDSYMGEIKVHMPTVCEYFEEGTGYLNVFTDLGWVVQNMWISSQYMNDGIPYMATKFHLREGPTSGLNINSIDAYIEFSTKPKGEFYGELYTTYPVGNNYAYYEGSYFIPTIPTPMVPPCFPTMFCNQTNHSNVQTACNQCGPAACANSLHYLEGQYPDRIDIPHELIPGLGRTADQKPIPPESTVSQLDLAMGRPNVVNRERGGLVYAFEFIEGKLRYLNDTGLGQCINVKHQGQYVARNLTIENLTSRNRGKDGSKVTTEFIFSEICNGEDVELLLAWPGGGGHYVDVTGVGLVCGKLKITHVSDQAQTHQEDADDNQGCDTVQSDWLEDDGNGNVRVVAGSSSPVGTKIEAVISQSPNNPPNQPEQPTGPTRLQPGENAEFRVEPATDTDEDPIQRYEWDFNGDGKVDEVTEEPEVIHSWAEQGTNEVRVRARDEYGAVSDWSDPLPVRVPKSKSMFNNFLHDFLKNYPILYQLLLILSKT